jgi:hypothetical protein
LHKEFATSLRPAISSQVFIRGVNPSATDNVLVNVMAVICGLALLVFACMATSGLDMSAGFF